MASEFEKGRHATPIASIPALGRPLLANNKWTVAQFFIVSPRSVQPYISHPHRIRPSCNRILSVNANWKKGQNLEENRTHLAPMKHL
jgi:hypothetical protein